MSVLLGTVAERGAFVSEDKLRRLARTTTQYATGDDVFHVSGRMGMVWQPYESHSRCQLEHGPIAGPSGNVVSFDGRLDNFCELAAQLDVAAESASDSMLVLKAFERWGDGCFRKFTGDWAAVLWSECEDALYLARDHAGTRTLYYRVNADGVQWATYIDTFFAEDQSPPLSEEYIAAYLAMRQIRELTPYKDIFAVPPGSFLIFRRGRIAVHRHWCPFGESELDYKSDQQYDEEFLARFRLAVARRAEVSPRIIAELSGGMDSNSIICMSDQIRRERNPASPLLDTVSYYDDADPSLDERRYFSITEAKRGKTGIHLNTTFSERTFLPHDSRQGSYLFPGADSLSIVREGRFHDRIWSSGYRVILSGIGGDELLGGVPDPYPELSGYLMAGAWGELVRQGIGWSLVNRDPLAETLILAIRHTMRSYAGRQQGASAPPWISRGMHELLREKTPEVSWRERLRHHTPRQLHNECTWWAIMETLPHRFPRILSRPEYRFPCLDKDLVEYLSRVPRHQLVRPGRRRAMMRRALAGIMPNEILERKQKAFQERSPLTALQDARGNVDALFRDSRLEQAGWIQLDAFRRELDEACAGSTMYLRSLMNTIALELWLHAGLPAQFAGHMGVGPSLVA